MRAYRLFATVALSLSCLLPGLWADTNTPFPAGASVEIKLATRSYVGQLKDSQFPQWALLVEAKTGAEVWIPVRGIDAITAAKTKGAGMKSDAPSAVKRYVVYVHGICAHAEHYSDPWFKAMKPYVPDVPDERHLEVLWSDLIAGKSADAGPKAAELGQILRDALSERADRQRMMLLPEGAADAPNPPAAAADLKQTLDCVQDFTTYLLDPDVRDKVIARFVDKVQPLLNDERAQVEVISHSWGTVVAYEALCRLETTKSKGAVHNFFTVGSALSISSVKSRLLPIARDGHRPNMVARWLNLNARFDVVGGAMKGRPFAVDQEFLNLSPFGCSAFWPNPVCAHGSYFESGNVAVNRDIFGEFIAR